MKIMAWNCRGLASARAVRALLAIQKREKPDVFFLSETHLGKAKAEELRRKLHCDHYSIVESDGRSGGLLLFWRKDISIRVQEISEFFIDVLIDDGSEWRFTGIYGDPRWDHKDNTWGRLGRSMGG
jgi:exonuclease III